MQIKYVLICLICTPALQAPLKRGKARDDGKGRGCLQAAAIDPKPPHWPA